MHRYKGLANLASHFFYGGLIKLYSCAHIPNTRLDNHWFSIRCTYPYPIGLRSDDCHWMESKTS